MTIPSTPIEFVPDIGNCRLCGATTRQREFWPEPFMHTGQSLRRCGHCALLYLAPDFTPQALDAFYAHTYRRLYLTERIGKDREAFFRQRREAPIAEERLRVVEALLPRGGRLFELGSGFGSFLGALARARPDVSLHASEHDIEHRGMRCADAVIDWRDTLSPPDAGSRYDVVAAFHVLEHLPRPAAFARQAMGALVRGGHLVVEVPDAEGDWRTRKYVHPAHLSYFSAATLRRTLLSAGFEVLRCTRHPANDLLPDTLLAVARRDEPTMRAIPVCAASESEIAQLDSRIAAVRWTLRDASRACFKRTAIALLGEQKTGAIQRWIASR